MAKLDKSEHIRFSFNWADYLNKIEDIQEDLDKLKKLGATHIEMDIETEWDVTSIKIKAFNIRKETDQEYSDRIIAEDLAGRKYDAEQNLREKETYERLKKKFEQ